MREHGYQNLRIDAFNLATEGYSTEQIAQKIAELRHKMQGYEAKYGCDYSTFVKQAATDEGFEALGIRACLRR